MVVKSATSFSEEALPVIWSDGVLAVLRGSKLFWGLWGFAWLNFDEGGGVSRYSIVAD
jgi:hypothetical protein